ncbi:amidohydrolase [Gammaproteobacteria bacterium]|nr:amidohydrolase [Gammaproteobacteria bacterium]|tara:strand:+ start:513 stop:1817 length:1305 start_codon:yes stop_codon:yes gene_type:complete
MKIIQYFTLLISVFLSSAIWAQEDFNLLELYKDLHSNPELSYKEEETSKKLASLLSGLGYVVTEGIGGYGVVAHLENGTGKTILIRADMDGLPVKEKTGASYASTRKSTNQVGQEVFTMHACGHDIHMTVLMGTARYMVENKDKWQGDLVLVLQPAEEVSGGARNMIKDGLFKNWPRPDYNLALHVSADIQAGKIGYLPGWAMANVDSVDIVVKGLGGHGAYPHKTKDPIVLAAQIINSLQTIISREIGPTQPAVLTVGSIHGGTKHNIIPNEVRLQLTLRSYTDEVRNKTITSIKRITRGLAVSAGMPAELYPEVILKDEYTPAVFNNPNLVKKLQSSFERSLGPENIFKTSPVMGGEDFGMFGRDEPIIPTALFWLGAVNKEVYDRSKKDNIALPSLHSDLFLPDPEPTIETGITAMSQAAIDLFGEDLQGP